MKKIKNFRSFFESKINEAFSLKEGGVYYYYIGSTKSYGLPEIRTVDLDILFDEKSSEWELPDINIHDLSYNYIHRELAELNIDSFLDDIINAIDYEEEIATEEIEELLKIYNLDQKYSAENIVKDPIYRKEFFGEFINSRNDIINEIKKRKFKIFKERIYPYDKVWNFIVVGDVKPRARFETDLRNSLYDSLKWLSDVSEGNFIILAYCTEEENFHILNRNDTFTDTGISVETTEESEEDEIARIISGFEITNNPIFITSLPLKLSRKIYDAKGINQRELDSLLNIKGLGLF